MKRRCAIGITDKYRHYNFIVEMNDKHQVGVYMPDYEPSVYNDDVDAYRIRFAVWYGPQVDWVDVIFYRYDALATPEFHDEGHVYNEFIPVVRNAVDGSGRVHDLTEWLAKKEDDIEPTVYVSLTVLESDGMGGFVENPNFNSGQGTILMSNKDKKYGIYITERSGEQFLAPFGPSIEESDTPFGPEYAPQYVFRRDDSKDEMVLYQKKKVAEYLDVYKGKDENMTWGLTSVEANSYSVFHSYAKNGKQFDDVRVRAYLLDNEHGYLALEGNTAKIENDKGEETADIGNGDLYYVSNIPLKQLLAPFKGKPATPGLKIQASITVNHDITFEFCSQTKDPITGKMRHNIDEATRTNQIMSYVTNIIVVDDELLGKVFADEIGTQNFTIENIYDSDMAITPVIIKDVTEQKVVEMKVNGDKNHIVQPIFFRVRDVANIIVHPHAKENICINLDAYKSSVESFRIKIEGVTFNEIARLEAGIVFNISGTMLPGAQGMGTYYVLNENGDLVTTGNYTYEY